MTPEQQSAIDEFFLAAEKLRSLGVIRSDRFLGDIAEFLVAKKLNVTLTSNKREQGFDGLLNEKKIEVKYNGGTSRTVSCGKPQTYDELVIVLGPKSVLRDQTLPDPYLFYRIPSDVVALKALHGDGKLRFGKKDLKPEMLLL